MSNYDKDLSVPEWDIRINTEEQCGYFEWVGGTNEDDEITGGLWFEGKVLVDYDGEFSLPDAVLNALISNGYEVKHGGDD